MTTEKILLSLQDGDITADKLARYNTQRAQLNIELLAIYPLAGPEWGRAVSSLVDAYAQTFLLRRLIVIAPEQADAIAQELHEYIDDGESLHEMTYQWAEEYDLDFDAIKAEARRFVDRKKSTPPVGEATT